MARPETRPRPQAESGPAGRLITQTIHVAEAAQHAFVTGFNAIALVTVAIAAVGAVAGYALIRSRDFVAAGRPAAAPPQPAPTHHDFDVAAPGAPALWDAASN